MQLDLEHPLVQIYLHLSSILAIGLDRGLPYMVGNCDVSRTLLFQILELELRWKCNKKSE